MEEKKSIREHDRFIVRLPDGMKEALARRAKANGRSMNSEIVEILARALRRGGSIDIEALSNRQMMLKAVVMTARENLMTAEAKLAETSEHLERAKAQGNSPRGG